jgi:hypothetical protein
MSAFSKVALARSLPPALMTKPWKWATSVGKEWLDYIFSSGIQVPVEQFDNALDQEPASRDLFLRYVHSCELQLAHSALANARYNVHERLARWLLMCHDRLEGDDLPLTHDFLSLMLGVRRSGVTNEIHIIEGLHAIKATRGSIRVINRAKLEEIAGGCYGIPEREYERLVGVSIRPDV